MLENVALVEQAKRSVNVNDILVTPIRVDGKKTGTHYDMTPDSNWKDINKFDQATQVKKTDGSSDALSDHLLKNVRTITELAYKNKYITEQDINRKDPLKDKDGKVVLGTEITPLSFLEIKNGKLVIPDILTAQQTQELMFLIYGKVVNNVDRDPNSRKQPEVLIEDIQKAMPNFSEDGKVDKSTKLILDTQSPQTVLRALNISLRKSVENAIKASTYSNTKDLERKGENATKRLLQRLEIGAQVKDEVDGPTIKKVIEGEMGVFTDKNDESRELEQTVQYDLLMAQAFDVLVPPEARLKMEQAEIAISKEPNYMEKAKKQADLTKTRQIWRIAMLDYFNASKLIPGTEFSQYANDLNNNKIFSPEEQDLVHKYSKEIGQRKANLDRRSGGGFNNLNIDSVNTLKAQELLLMLKPAGTVQIPEGLTQIFARAHEITEVVGDTPKEIKSKKEALIKSLMKDSRILNGLQTEKSELAKKILRDAIITKNSIDKRLRNMPNGDVDVNYATLDFASSIDSGVKGIDLLYRRGLSQIIDEADRYHGHDIVRDANEKTHLMRKLKKGEKRSKKDGFGEDLPSGGASSRGGEASMQQEHVESTETTAPVAKTENKSVATKTEKDQWAAEIAPILGIKSEVKVLKDLVDALRLDKRLDIKFKDNRFESADLNLGQLDLKSAVDLKIIAEMSNNLEGVKIQIDSLNLTIAESDKPIEQTLRGFNITNLVLSGPMSVKDERGTPNYFINQITLSDGGAKFITVEQGTFRLAINQAPEKVIMTKNSLEKTIDFVMTEDAIKELLTDDSLRTIFSIDGESRVIIYQGESIEQAAEKIIYTDLHEGATWSGDQKIDGDNILVIENGVYILKPKPEAEKAPGADTSTGTQSSTSEEGNIRKVGSILSGSDLVVGDTVSIVNSIKYEEGIFEGYDKESNAIIRQGRSTPRWGQGTQFRLITPFEPEPASEPAPPRGRPVPLNIDKDLEARYEALQDSDPAQPVTASPSSRFTTLTGLSSKAHVQEEQTIADPDDVPAWLRRTRGTAPIPAPATAPAVVDVPAPEKSTQPLNSTAQEQDGADDDLKAWVESLDNDDMEATQPIKAVKRSETLGLEDDGTQSVENIILNTPDNPLFPGHSLQKAMIRSGFSAEYSSSFINYFNDIVSNKTFDADRLDELLTKRFFEDIAQAQDGEALFGLCQYVVKSAGLVEDSTNYRSASLHLLEQIANRRVDLYTRFDRAEILKNEIDLVTVYINKPTKSGLKGIIRSLQTRLDSLAGYESEDSKFNSDKLVENILLTTYKGKQEDAFSSAGRGWDLDQECVEVFNSPEAETFLMYVQNGQISTKSKDFFSKFHTRIDSLDYEIVGDAEVKLQKKWPSAIGPFEQGTSAPAGDDREPHIVESQVSAKLIVDQEKPAETQDIPGREVIEEIKKSQFNKSGQLDVVLLDDNNNEEVSLKGRFNRQFDAVFSMIAGVRIDELRDIGKGKDGFITKRGEGVNLVHQLGNEVLKALCADVPHVSSIGFDLTEFYDLNHNLDFGDKINQFIKQHNYELAGREFLVLYETQLKNIDSIKKVSPIKYGEPLSSTAQEQNNTDLEAWLKGLDDEIDLPDADLPEPPTKPKRIRKVAGK